MKLVVPLVGKARKLARRMTFGGLSISVETDKGQKRHWHDPHSGESGSTSMQHPYGYIRGSMGTDGDHVDVYVGPHEDATHAYVIDQMKKPDFKEFDEQKVMLGFKSASAAKKAYLAHYNDPRFFGSMKAIPFAEFATKVLATKDAKHKMVKGVLSLDVLKSVRGGAAPTHKYKRRWLENGEWHYEYDEPEKSGGRTGAHPLDHDRMRALVDQLTQRALDGVPSANIEPWFEVVRRGESEEKTVVRGGSGASFMHATHPQFGTITIALRVKPNAYAFGGSFQHNMSAATAARNKRGTITIDMPDSALTLAAVKREMRRVLSHEWTHSVDRTLEGEAQNAKRSAKAQAEVRALNASDEAYSKYRNQKIEVTAKIQEVHRDLTDKAAVADARKMLEDQEADPDWEYTAGPDILSWAGKHSKIIRNEMEVYTPENQKRIMRAITDTFERIREGNVKPIEKAMLDSRGLALLLKSGPPGAGWQAIPGGHHGGFRRRKGAEWEYWYPDNAAASPARTWKTSHDFTEHDFASGEFDKDPTHWHWKQTDGELHAWTRGGVDPHSKRPVKVGGNFAKLYSIEHAESDKHPGFAVLRDLGSGELILMQHDRVFPIEHDPLKRKTIAKPEGPRWDPTQGRKPPVTSTTGAAKQAPSFEGSTADPQKQPGLYAIENGAYPMKSIARVETADDGRVTRTKDEIIAVPDTGKNLLVKEFEGLIANTAKKMQRAYGVRDTFEQTATGRSVNMTRIELQRAGIEGLLAAIESYDASVPFAAHAKLNVENYVRLATARERLGGVTLSQRHERNLARYIAARTEAAKALGVDEPTAEQVVPFFRLLKKHVHGNLSTKEGNKPVPSMGYTLSTTEEVPGEEAPRVVKDTRTHPGKHELADLYHSFLMGQASSEDIHDLDDKYAFPALGIGAGLAPHERILVRRATQSVLSKMEKFSFTTEGRKKITYSGDAGEMIALKLGLGEGDRDEKTFAEIAREVPVYANGKQLAPRQAVEVVEEMVQRAMQHVSKQIEQADAAPLFARAVERVMPAEVVPQGPTWSEIIRDRAARVTRDQIGEYKASERSRLSGILERMRARRQAVQHIEAAEEALRRVDRISDEEARMKIATRLSPETAEMRRLATQSVEVEIEHRGYEYGSQVMTLTDLATGRQRRVRVRTLRDLRDPEEMPDTEVHGVMRKAFAGRLTTGMLREAARYPRTMRLLTAPDDPVAAAPTLARRVVETLALGE